MVKRAIVVAIVLSTASLQSHVLACGDKFFVPSRGTQFHGPIVDRGSAKILIYAAPGSPLSNTLASLAVEKALRRAGYHPVSVDSATAFDSALRGGNWDVVVVDLVDGASVLGRVSASAAAGVLPVAWRETEKASLDVALQHYRQVLRTPRKDRAFLDAIDKTVAARAKARAKTVIKGTD